ncbi:hypothetical protein CSUI_011291 [Cystoisospora suis]|uniref:Transmembrane protein n=1 Tax=Cystoisospora suis TaxID=483139 RepID=A0A2C6KBT5_9APIC|nr:hypothetical protein CSUI_011291 [Cystoisospora suis]
MARPAAAGCFFLLFTLCSAQQSAPTDPGSTVFEGASSEHVGEEGGRQVFQNSPGKARIDQEQPHEAGVQRTVESEAGNSLVSRRRRSSTSSIYKKSFAGLLSRPSGTVRKLLLATTLSVMAALWLWRVGKVILECLAEEETQDRPGLISRSLSVSERKKECHDLGLSPSGNTSGALGLRNPPNNTEFLLVTVAVSLIVLAALAAFIYLTVQELTKEKTTPAPTDASGPSSATNGTTATPTSPPQPVGPGAPAAKTLAGALMLAVGMFAFYLYLRVQREARRGAPPRGTPSAYTTFFTFWCLVFVISSTCSFLVLGNFVSWLVIGVALFAIILFAQTYRGTLPLRPQGGLRLDV